MSRLDILADLCGQDGPPLPGRLIRCGGLTATLMPDGAGLRDVAFDGEVILRGLAFVVRDAKWGTYALGGSRCRSHDGDSITIVASGRVDGPEGDLDWRASFVVRPEGIEATAELCSPTGFTTNRAGLVVLHAVGAARGQPAHIGHADGRRTIAAFPIHVAPHQPFHDVAWLEHGTSGGTHVRLTFEGEVFETEDQRNWTDASFKTYGRPLALGFPYRLAAGVRTTQHISMRFDAGGSGESGARNRLAEAPTPLGVVAAPVALPDLVIRDWDDVAPHYFAHRNRQPDAHPDWTWASCPTVHASDDDTIGESIEALTDLVATAKAREPSCRISVQPIRLRSGSEPDGREGSIIEAAWMLATIIGYLDPVVDRLGVDEPKDATRVLLDRLLPYRGHPVQPVTWPGLDRLKGVRIGSGNAAVLAIAHLRHAHADIVLPAGAWTQVSWLLDTGFCPAEPTGMELAFDGFCVAWLSMEA